MAAQVDLEWADREWEFPEPVFPVAARLEMRPSLDRRLGADRETSAAGTQELVPAARMPARGILSAAAAGELLSTRMREASGSTRATLVSRVPDLAGRIPALRADQLEAQGRAMGSQALAAEQELDQVGEAVAEELAEVRLVARAFGELHLGAVMVTQPRPADGPALPPEFEADARPARAMLKVRWRSKPG